MTAHRNLPSREVCDRYGIVIRTLDRWLKDKAVGFPAPADVIRGRRYWSEANLIEWERTRATARPVAAATVLPDAHD